MADVFQASLLYANVAYLPIPKQKISLVYANVAYSPPILPALTMDSFDGIFAKGTITDLGVGVITDYGFLVGTDPSLITPITYSYGEITTTGQFTKHLPPQPAGIYYVKCFATNPAGTIISTNTVIFVSDGHIGWSGTIFNIMPDAVCVGNDPILSINILKVCSGASSI